eukprot:944489-Rhodomonas_salina.1
MSAPGYEAWGSGIRPDCQLLSSLPPGATPQRLVLQGADSVCHNSCVLLITPFPHRGGTLQPLLRVTSIVMRLRGGTGRSGLPYLLLSPSIP